MIKYLAFIFFAFLISCGSTRNESDKVPCFNKKSKNFTIRWGNFQADKEQYMGYQIDIYGDLSFYSKSGNQADKIEKMIRLETDDACKVIDMANRAAVGSQALFSPADQGASNFVQYTIPEENVYIMAVWNPKFQTQGSQLFRDLFDSLQSLVPSASQIK